jgi:hypothetical protein
MQWGMAAMGTPDRIFDLMAGVLFRLGLIVIALAIVLQMGRRTKTRPKR